VVPISRLLGLSMPQSAAARIVFFLAVQILVAILAGQLNGTLKAVGFPHRAETWGQVRLALSFGVTWVLAALGKPFWTIPVAQTLMYAVAAGCSLADLRRLAPRAFPTLSYWDRATARLVLKPSLWFGSFTLNQFLLFESPVLLLNWFAGKPAVVTFTLCRTYFGMIRQPLNVIRFALRPEITRLAAVQDWGVMQRAYGVLVSLSFSAALIGAPLFLLGAPVLLPLWTKRSDMFDPQLYGAMALATLLIVAKDCRLELQYSTNRHIRSAAICLISYAAYSILGIPATILGGPLLLVLLWGLVEAVQLALIHGENRLLLPSLTLRDAGMLIVAGSLAIGVADVMTTALPHAGVLSVLAWVAAMAAVLVIAAVVLFNLWETARLMIVRLLDRSLAVPAARIAGDAA
jgi:hypothetical protein